MISDSGIHSFLTLFDARRMNERIGPRRPFRHYIREWIDHKGLTQAQVAARIGCAESTLSKKINTRSGLTMGWTARIAEALDVEPLALFRDPKAPYPEDLLRDVPEDQRARITQALRLLTGTDS